MTSLQLTYLVAFREIGHQTEAARAAGVHPVTVSKWKRLQPEFLQAFHESANVHLANFQSEIQATAARSRQQWRQNRERRETCERSYAKGYQAGLRRAAAQNAAG